MIVTLESLLVVEDSKLGPAQTDICCGGSYLDDDGDLDTYIAPGVGAGAVNLGVICGARNIQSNFFCEDLFCLFVCCKSKVDDKFMAFIQKKCMAISTSYFTMSNFGRVKAT